MNNIERFYNELIEIVGRDPIVEEKREVVDLLKRVYNSGYTDYMVTHKEAINERDECEFRKRDDA